MFWLFLKPQFGLTVFQRARELVYKASTLESPVSSSNPVTESRGNITSFLQFKPYFKTLSSFTALLDSPGVEFSERFGMLESCISCCKVNANVLRTISTKITSTFVALIWSILGLTNFLILLVCFCFIPCYIDRHCGVTNLF